MSTWTSDELKFKTALEASGELEPTGTGRTSSREISNPVSFVRERDKLYLVPGTIKPPPEGARLSASRPRDLFSRYGWGRSRTPLTGKTFPERGLSDCAWRDSNPRPTA
jgi:hypothetical protein